MEISEMTLADYEIIKDKLQEEYDDFWTESILKKELEDVNSEYIVIKSNEDILGFAGIWKSPVDCQITNIVVKKTCRKQGIGSLLLEKLIEIAKTTSFEMVGLEVNENNISAIKLYEKYGFQKVGVRKKYYNNTDNAILMDLKIHYLQRFIFVIA